MGRPKLKVAWPPSPPRGFPLTVVDSGYVKTIGGRTRWICGKRTPDEALAIYHRKAGALVTGHKPVEAPKPIEGIVTLHYILARWLKDRRADVEGGKLKAATYAQYKRSAKRIDDRMGGVPVTEFSPDHVKALHIAIAEDDKADAAARAMEHLRMCCGHAEDSRWCGHVQLGRKLIGKLSARPKNAMKWKLFTPEQVGQILDAVKGKLKTCDGRGRPSWEQMHAMILLALNGGYGAAELSELTRDAIDLAGAKVTHKRGKTGAPHIVPLWPETVEALKLAMAQRPGDVLAFRTRQGNPWCRTYAKRNAKGQVDKASGADHVNERFTELVKPIGLKIDRQGFYKLKHLFATTAGDSIDRDAVTILMGHRLAGSKGHYVEVREDRLRDVVNFVRHQLLIPQRVI